MNAGGLYCLVWTDQSDQRIVLSWFIVKTIIERRIFEEKQNGQRSLSCEMLQQGFYDATNPDNCSGSEANNNSTPFSVKDILNMVESGGGTVDGYLSCQMER